MAQPPPFEDTKLGAQALAYVIELYDELTVENGAPTLGTQNQAVDFIRADPELRLAVADWAKERGDRRSDDGAAAAPAVRPAIRPGSCLSRTDHDSVNLLDSRGCAIAARS